MEKMNGMSKDLLMENIEQLKHIFPQAVTEGKIDFDVLKELLGESVEEKEEFYRFTWHGKTAARRHALTPSAGTLRPCAEESSGKDGSPGKFDSENLYIEGDNLEVLKLLQGAYHRKVKMIYIDPPYNTGKDFVYKDNYTAPLQEYQRLTGQIDVEGKRTSSNTDAGGEYHTNWLNMMYPRLILAHKLLTDDGVIFISIDDTEIDNLKKLCNDLFGEENFIAVFTRVTKKGGKSSEATAKNHDFILMFAKSRAEASLSGVFHTDDGYSKQDEYFEERGFYKANQTLDYDSLGYVKTLDYPIVIDDEIFYAGGNVDDYNRRQDGQHGRADWGWRWRWSKDLLCFGLQNGFIEIHRGGVRPRIYTKTYQNVEIQKINGEYRIVQIDRTKPLSTLEFTDNKYSNDNAKKSFDQLMERGIFEYTKPISLIVQIDKLINDKQSVILDFFSGSGTTANAVMQLNSEDGGNRKFIMVQLPEVCAEGTEAAKAGYKNICEIGKERIRRAAKKIKEEKPLFAGDVGFRVLKLDTSNYVPWNIELSEGELLVNRVDNLVDGRSAEDLLYEVLLKNNQMPTLPVDKVQCGENTIHVVAAGSAFVCLDRRITTETVAEIVRLRRERYAAAIDPQAILRESAFGRDDAKLNAGLALEHAGFKPQSIIMV